MDRTQVAELLVFLLYSPALRSAIHWFSAYRLGAEQLRRSGDASCNGQVTSTQYW